MRRCFKTLVGAALLAQMVEAAPPKLVIKSTVKEGVESTAPHVLEVDAVPIAVNAPTATVAIPLTIENRSASEVTTAFVNVSFFGANAWRQGTFINEQGQSVAETKIAAYGSFSVVVRATLPETGLWHGVMRLKYSAPPATVSTMLINVTRQELPMDLAEFGGVEHALSLCGSNEVRFDAHVRNNGTEQITLRPPFLRSIMYKPTADVPIAGPSVDLQFASAAPKVVETENDETVPMIVTGITRPGRYDLLIRMAAAGATSAEKTLVIHARESSLMLFFFVGIGLLISYLMRAWGTIIRPRLLVEKNVAMMLDSLRDCMVLARDDVEAVALIQTLRDQIRDELKRLSLLGQLAGATVFNTYERKVRLAGQWLDRWNGIRSVRPESVRTEAERELRSVSRVLVTSTVTDADLDLQQGALDTFSLWLNEQLLATLEKVLASLETEIRAKNDPRFDDLLREAEGITPLLKPPTVEAAVDALIALRQRYLAMLAKDLLAKLGTSKPVPGFDVDTWRRVVERTQDAILSAQERSDPDDAATNFAFAVGSYLRTIVDGLSGYVDEMIANSNQATAYAALKPAIAAIVIDVEAGRLDAAMNASDIVIANIQTIATPATKVLTMRPSATRLPALGGFDLFGALRGGTTTSQVGSSPRGAYVQRKLEIMDFVTSFVAVILTLGIAYQTLWVSDLTWGGTAAHIAAVLWGAGIHQLTWSGLSGLVSAFRGT